MISVFISVSSFLFLLVSLFSFSLVFYFSPYCVLQKIYTSPLLPTVKAHFIKWKDETTMRLRTINGKPIDSGTLLSSPAFKCVCKKRHSSSLTFWKQKNKFPSPTITLLCTISTTLLQFIRFFFIMSADLSETMSKPHPPLHTHWALIQYMFVMAQHELKPESLSFVQKSQNQDWSAHCPQRSDLPAL